MTDTTSTHDPVQDHLDLHGALTGYCRAVDRMDLTLLRSHFAPAARLDFSGLFEGPVEDFAQWLIDNLGAYGFTVHSLSNVHLEVDGDRAASESYVTALHGATLDGSRAPFRSGGRYLDRWERRDGRWLITERTALVVWSEPAADVTHPTEGSRYGASRSRRDLTDPSYDLLALQETR